MQFNRVRISNRSQKLFGNMNHRTGLTTNLLARFAICFSLRDPSIPNPDAYDETGTEILPSVLFGKYEKMFIALMLERLYRDGLDTEKYLNRMIRAHINRGAIALHPRIKDLGDFYEVIQVEKES